MTKFGVGVIAAAVLLLASGGATGEGQQKAGRFPQFENADVRVWKSVVTPNSPLSMHRHDHPRVVVALVGGDMKSVEQSGQSETHHWETGKAYWLPAMPPGAMHADVNAGSKTMEVMVVELKNAK